MHIDIFGGSIIKILEDIQIQASVKKITNIMILSNGLCIKRILFKNIWKAQDTNCKKYYLSC